MTRFTKVILGHKYGMLTPIEFSGSTKDKNLLVRCICDCGRETITRATHLTTGKTKSCGCLKGFGLSYSITYESWMKARRRCCCKTDEHYPSYGGRGIKVCERWVDSYKNFLEDMGERPSRDHTLDRIDVNGDYCPENCRWATRVQQGNNRRNNRFIEYAGKRMTLADFAREYHIEPFRVQYGLRKGLGFNEIIEKFKDRPVRHLSRLKDKLKNK